MKRRREKARVEEEEDEEKEQRPALLEGLDRVREPLRKRRGLVEWQTALKGKEEKKGERMIWWGVKREIIEQRIESKRVLSTNKAINESSQHSAAQREKAIGFWIPFSQGRAAAYAVKESLSAQQQQWLRQRGRLPAEREGPRCRPCASGACACRHLCV